MGKKLERNLNELVEWEDYVTPVNAANLNAIKNKIISNSGDINTLSQTIVNLQPKTDNSLQTTSKSVVGAINELRNSKFDKVTITGNVLKFYANNVEKASITLPESETVDLSEINNALAKKYDNVELVGQELKFYVGSILKKTINLPVGEGGSVDLSAYQQKNDSTLTTADKTVVGAINEVNSHTSQKANVSFVENMVRANKIGSIFLDKPAITFIDDDGDENVYTRFKDIFNTYNVPCCCAIITGTVDTPGVMTRSQVLELYSMGWEMLGHGDVYENNILENSDRVWQNQQLNGCKKKLNDWGIAVNGFVYPQNQSDVGVRKITSQGYDYAFSNLGFNDGEFLDTLRIKRIAFGSWTSDNPTVDGNNEKNTFEYYKKCIDYAEKNNIWLIFMLHARQQSLEDDNILSQTIEYIKSKNIDIITAKEGYKRFGNSTFVGDLDEQFVVTNKNGLFTKNMQYFNQKTDSVNLTTSIDEFKLNAISLCPISFNHANTNGFPEVAAGIMATFKFSNTVKTYNYQEFWSSTGKKFIRNISSTGEWLAFEPINFIKKNSINVPETVIEANTYKTVHIDFSGLNPNTSFVNAIPTWGIEEHVSYIVFCSASNKISIRFFNHKASQVTLVARKWTIITG